MLNFENIVISKTSYQKIVFPCVNFNENQQAYTTFDALSENGHRKHFFIEFKAQLKKIRI